ncbi:hypothetical protein PG991_014748 [Apiospora marii]|uniref:2-oxoadipate dioxygenase/decarboxylase n=1 Tax=Apiospora marii TaxID=335849 RepID=A0ABR1R4E4_9PEZI
MLHATPAQCLQPQDPVPDAASYVHADDLRTAFAAAMSQMYKNEVPLYGDLVRIVQGVNQAALSAGNDSSANSKTSDSPERLSLERHGAIRLGLPHELRTVRRIFAVLGMYPVGYYDLSVAGLPMHATCFRPTTSESLARNPFRIFTTLLQPELVKTNGGARDLALQLLSRRTLFSSELLSMLDMAEQQQEGRLYADQAEIFIREALRTFSWASGVAASTLEEYSRLRAEHPVLADITCFRTAHINHLTPRTLDIDAAQRAMISEGMAVKDRIEGPPRRRCPILLRQTSFLALEEPVHFLSEQLGDNTTSEEGQRRLVEGSHCARFGEIEERGAAVTAAGRRLYDELLAEATGAVGSSKDGRAYDEVLVETFRDRFPDDLRELCRQQLVFCRYRCTGKQPNAMPPDFAALLGQDANTAQVQDVMEKYEDAVMTWAHRLVDDGVLVAEPITYEDFLPFSAAGIFQSNLQRATMKEDAEVSKQAKSSSPPPLRGQTSGSQSSSEEALGCAITDPDTLYAQAQKESLLACLLELGLARTRI